MRSPAFYFDDREARQEVARYGRELKTTGRFGWALTAALRKRKTKTRQDWRQTEDFGTDLRI